MSDNIRQKIEALHEADDHQSIVELILAIPPEERDRLLVAADSEGIIWAEGFGADRRCVWREDSQRGCVFEIIVGEDRKNGEA